jgi:hypothetical protein
LDNQIRLHKNHPTKAIPVPIMQNIPSLIWNLFSGSPLTPDSKTAAEFWLSMGELGLVIFAVVVIIGLIGEERVEKHEKRWIPPKHGKKFPWMAIWVWSVVVGILGELFCDADIWVSSDVTQIISDAETKLAQKETARANEAAGRANERAGKLEAQAANLLNEAAQANDRAAQAERDLAAFKAARSLDGDKTKKILSALSNFKDVPFVISVQQDPEPLALALQLGDALNNAGWHWVSYPPNGPAYLIPGKPAMGLSVTSGVHIYVDEAKEEQWRFAINALLMGLRTANIVADATKIIDGTEPVKDALHIYIGQKPI